ncbi:MAG: hypothetical protein OEW00_10530 [candidate division Zixibacteria bacterium]|nr:hypothetical protein [candidate division Zixibacteria bacterium]
MRAMRVILAASLLAAFLGCLSVADTIVKLDYPNPGEVQVAGFELFRDGQVVVNAVGFMPRHMDDYGIYSWIIDADSRQPVWEMEDAEGESYDGKRHLREVSEELKLPRGKYEVYLYAVHEGYVESVDGDFFTLFGIGFSGRDYRNFEKALDACFVSVAADQSDKADFGTYKVADEARDALLKFTGLGDSEYIEKGFALDKPLKLRIYSVFEFPRGRDFPVDYGWIMNADTRERVWEISEDNSDWAGGGKKNCLVDEVISLDKGKYLLYFVTDDSHSFEQFNANPPWDPTSWGITIFGAGGADASAFSSFDPPERKDALLSMTKVRNDRYLEQPFRLEKEANLQIQAIGEYSDGDDEFVDGAWIHRADSRKNVWEMTWDNTQHAGGAEKNRMFDGTVTLPKGDYVACYASDGSHAYRHWNSAPPFNPNAWGLTVYPGKGCQPGDFKEISSSETASSKDILVSITRIRDNDERHATFKLERPARVHVYAVGEGSRREMYDYGWIVDEASGRSVWEMTWRNTDHAGGATKNRVYDDEIELDAGEYEVWYTTDGSHSYRDWNDTRPRDPDSWGITVSLVE